MIIIGSVALKEALKKYNSYLPRAPQDIDTICYRWEMEDFCKLNNILIVKSPLYDKYEGTYIYNGIERHIEFELCTDSGYRYDNYISEYKKGTQVEAEKILLDYGLKTVKLEDKFTDIKLAPLEVLFSIKKSHIHYPLNFQKHIEDYSLIQRFMKLDLLEKITKIREKETEKRFGKIKTPSLDKTKDDFFNDNVSNRTFIHDEIHQIMAHQEKPMFEYIKEDTDSVKCSKDKFNSLKDTHKNMCVLEEAYVIALERILIPMIYTGGPIATADKAIKWSLMRICTTLTSGWFREYATNNYRNIYDCYDKQYADRFFDAVDKGKIKKICH